MTEPIWSTGGSGGERAVTEDLDWAVGALRRAAVLIGMAADELTRRAAVADLLTPGPQSLTWEVVRAAAHAGPLLEIQLDEAALRLSEVSAAYLEAERRARHRVGLADAFVEAAADAAGRGLWLARVGGGLVALGSPLGMFADDFLPDGPPPTTGVLTRDTVQTALALTQYQQLVGALELVVAMSMGSLVLRWRGRLSAEPVAAAPAHSLYDVMDRLQDVHVSGGGALRIERWTDDAGVTRRIAYIPGTQDWLGLSRNPSDLNADLALMSGGLPDAAGVVTAALEADGAQPGDPVMLVGHSLGGIVATALAANSSVTSRFTIEAVVTAGSPTGRITLPPTVQALHLEGTRDIVPGLDGRPNPDTPTRVTVHHDVRDSEVAGLAGAGENILSAHHFDTYAETARLVDEGLSASTDAWLAEEQDFFAPGKRTEVTEYRP